MRKCTKCFIEKDVDGFHTSPMGRLYPWCITCRSEPPVIKIVKTKICKRCGEDELEKFDKTSTGRQTLNCRSCVVKILKERKVKSREYYNPEKEIPREQRDRQNEAARIRRASLTPEEKEIVLKNERDRHAKRITRMTPEEREAHYNKKRIDSKLYSETITKEKKKEKSKYNALKERNRRAALSPEEKKEEARKNKEAREALSEEKKEEIRAASRQRYKESRKNMTKEDIEANNKIARGKAREKYAMMTPAEKKVFNKRGNKLGAEKRKRAYEALSPAEKRKHLDDIYAKQALRISKMSPEEWNERRERLNHSARAREAKRIAKMTLGEREDFLENRRVKEKERAAFKRDLKIRQENNNSNL